MVCIPVGQFCQFLIFLIILYWSNVNTSARNHVSIILLLCFIVEIQKKILLSFHAVATVAYFSPPPPLKSITDFYIWGILRPLTACAKL